MSTSPPHGEHTRAGGAGRKRADPGLGLLSKLPRELRDEIYALAYGHASVHVADSYEVVDDLGGVTSSFDFQVCGRRHHPSDVYRWSRQGADPLEPCHYRHPILRDDGHLGLNECEHDTGHDTGMAMGSGYPERLLVPLVSAVFLAEALAEAQRTLTLVFHDPLILRGFLEKDGLTQPERYRRILLHVRDGLNPGWIGAVKPSLFSRFRTLVRLDIQLVIDTDWWVPTHNHPPSGWTNSNWPLASTPIDCRHAIEDEIGIWALDLPSFIRAVQETPVGDQVFLVVEETLVPGETPPPRVPVKHRLRVDEWMRYWIARPERA